MSVSLIFLDVTKFANPPRKACSGIAKKCAFQLRTSVVTSQKAKVWYEFAYRRRNQYVLTMSVSKKKVRELFQYQTSYLRVSVSSFSYTHCYVHHVSCAASDLSTRRSAALQTCGEPCQLSWQDPLPNGTLPSPPAPSRLRSVSRTSKLHRWSTPHPCH